MPWARIHDRANTDAKLLALSDGAHRMWVGGLVFCQANLTNGFIPAHAIETFGVRARNKAALVKELTTGILGKAPLWQVAEGGWHVNDFLDWNDDREKVLRKRKAGKDRIDKFRAKLNAGRNGAHNEDCNALQTPNKHSSFAASTTTTTDQNPEEPRADRAPRAMARMSMVEARPHLQAAAHLHLDAHPDATDGDVREAVKTAAAKLNADYDGRAIATVVDAVVARRARRLA